MERRKSYTHYHVFNLQCSMKKTLLASLISATSLFACCGPVLAADYYVVAPLPGKAAQVAAINVGLNGYAIPEAIVGSAYAGFDFKSVLSVTGDSAYNGSLVSWSVVSGALPAGLVLNADGTLSGTPTLVETSNFTLKATYKTKMGQQVYQLVSTAQAALAANCKRDTNGQVWCIGNDNSDSGALLCGYPTGYSGVYYAATVAAAVAHGKTLVSNVDCATNYTDNGDASKISGAKLTCWTDSQRWARTGAAAGANSRVFVRCANME